MGSDISFEQKSQRQGRPLVEQRLRLDLTHLRHVSGYPRRRRIPVTLTAGGDRKGATEALLMIWGDSAEISCSTAAGPLLQRIELTETACHFGGARPWFRCPGIGADSCGRRAGALFLDPASNRFACRRCLGLAYASQRLPIERRTDALRRRYARKLHAAGLGPLSTPRRPKGMHTWTYIRLVSAYQLLAQLSLSVPILDGLKILAGSSRSQKRMQRELFDAELESLGQEPIGSPQDAIRRVARDTHREARIVARTRRADVFPERNATAGSA
jgi:hypothetical protein